MGRLGFLRPTRALRMAREMATTASSCPMTRWCSVSSILIRRSLSSLDTCAHGTPTVQNVLTSPKGDMLKRPQGVIPAFEGVVREIKVTHVNTSQAGRPVVHLDLFWTTTCLCVNMDKLRSSEALTTVNG